MALYYAALFMVIGVQLPFFPVWLRARGLDSEFIGVVLAVPLVARIVAVPVASRLSDRWKAPKGMLIGLSVAAAIGYSALGLANGIVPIIVCLALASIAYAPTTSIADAYALHGLALRKRAYGPIRLWGSAAFIAANLITGFALNFLKADHLIWLAVAAQVFAIAAAFALVPQHPDDTEQEARSARGAGHFYSPPFVMMALAASLIQASHTLYYSFSTLDWGAHGLGGTAIGTLWSIGVVAEIGVFAVSGRFVSVVSPSVLVAIGALGAVVRWGAMALSPPVALLPLLQCLHGLSFAATHLGSVQYVAQAVPAERRATAMGDFSTMISLAMAFGMLLSGGLYARYGGQAYAGMAVLAAIGAALVLLASRLRSS
jgi:PPP family 3-phenylpropionic acid transporter